MIKMKFALTWAVAAGAIGSGFQHGYNTGVLNSPQAVMEEWTRKLLGNPSNFVVKMYWSIVVSSFCVGGMIGGAMSGIMANRFGRKGSLLMNNVLVLVGAISMVLAKYINNIYLLIAGRFIIGINTGLNSGIGPTYLYEIAPVSHRGAIGTIYQMVITITILLGQILSIDSLLGSVTLWDYLFCVIIIPAIYQSLALWKAAESPRHVLQKENDTLSLLHTVRSLYPEERVLQIALEVWNDVQDGKDLPKATIKRLFQTQRLRIPTMIILALMLSQQTSGIDIVISYSTGLFKLKGFRSITAHVVTFGIGIVNMLTTLLLVFVVDVVGRKPLLLIGFCGMIISTVVRNGSVLGSESLWPYMFGLMLVPAIFQVIAFIWAPESPRYMYLKENDSVRLYEVLSKMYSDENIMARMHEVQEDIEDGRGQEALKFNEMLRKQSLLTPMSTVIMLMLIQLLSGINIGVQDAAFGLKGLESRTRHYNQSANLLATVVCVFLVDRVGRKMLMLFSLGIMILTTIVIFISLYLIPLHDYFVYICVAAIFLFALGYGLGVAPIPWVIATEMFNTATRMRAVGFCVLVSWFFKLAFTLSVVALQVALGPAVYFIFMASQTLGFIFAWIFMPETSNMPVTLVTAHFRRQAKERILSVSGSAPRRTQYL